MPETVYFEPPSWPPELELLQSVIGFGRHARTEAVSLWLSLRANRVSGRPCPLLPIEFSLERQTVCAWVEETALTEWLEPILPVPEIAALTKDMRCAACAWTLAPWLNWCAQHELSTPALKALGEGGGVLPAAISEPVCVVLTLATDHADICKRLDLTLTGFPYAWLSAFASSMSARPEPRMQVQRMDVKGSAGFARISMDQLVALRAGDVVLAAGQAPLSEGRVFCQIGLLFFQARWLDEHHFEVERIMTALDEDREMIAVISETAQSLPESAVGDLPVTLIFEIGRMSVPLSKLARLQVGDVLETEFEPAPEIGIRAQGKLIASAKLVRIGERLGAQITQMMNPELKQREEVDKSKGANDPAVQNGERTSKPDKMASQ